MRKLKKKILSAALTLGVLAVLLPTAVFANENYTAQLVMEASAEQGEFPKPGEQVKVSLYLQNAGWAQEVKGTGWGGGLIQLTYDQTVLQYVDFVEEEAVSDVLDDIVENHVDQGTTGEVFWLGMNSQLAKELSFTDKKTKLGEILFEVKKPLPNGLDGAPVFGYPEAMEFQFGDLDNPDHSASGVENAVVTPVFENHIKFDTTAPTITLDGSDQTKFYYSPVMAVVKDTNGVGSATLNGVTLSAPYAITKSGALVVTDPQGNQTRVDVVIDDAAYLAAKTAIERLPDRIGTDAAGMVAAARKAVDEVTDPTARNKLDIVRLEKAEATLDSLLKEKAALVQEIAEADFIITLKKENVEAIDSLQAKVDALTAKGASFTAQELENLTRARTAMDELQKRSQAAHTAIAKLPTAENTMWGDSQKLEALKEEIQALEKLEDVFTPEETAKLTEVEKGLEDIAKRKVEIEAEVQTILGKELSSDLAIQINAVKEKLEEKGIPGTQVKDYDKLLALADHLQDFLDQIDAVTQQIRALPEAEKIGFGDEKAVQAAAKALKKLQEKNLDVTDKVREKLGAAQRELETLKEARAALVQQIKDSKLSVDLTSESAAAIHALREKADTLNKRGAELTARELKVLTSAEAELAELQNRSQDAHKAIAGLPSSDKIRWSDKETVEGIRKQVLELSQLGDVFTENEEKKLADAEAVLKSIQTDADQLKAQLEALPEQAESGSAAVLTELEQKITALNNRGYAVDESTMGKTAMKRYKAYKKAVEAGTTAPATTSPTAPSNTTVPTVPTTAAGSSPTVQTGDTFDPLWMVGLMTVSGAVALYTYRRKKCE